MYNNAVSVLLEVRGCRCPPVQRSSVWNFIKQIVLITGKIQARNEYRYVLVLAQLLIPWLVPKRNLFSKQLVFLRPLRSIFSFSTVFRGSLRTKKMQRNDNQIRVQIKVRFFISRKVGLTSASCGSTFLFFSTNVDIFYRKKYLNSRILIAAR